LFQHFDLAESFISQVHISEVLLELHNEVGPGVRAVMFAIHHILDAYAPPMFYCSFLHVGEGKDDFLLLCVELCFISPDVEGTFMEKVGESFPIPIEWGRGLYAEAFLICGGHSLGRHWGRSGRQWWWESCSYS